jgi:hypothetical protein
MAGRDATFGEARLTAAPQERPLKARDRGRPRAAGFAGRFSSRGQR